MTTLWPFWLPVEAFTSNGSSGTLTHHLPGLVIVHGTERLGKPVSQAYDGTTLDILGLLGLSCLE